MKRISSSSFKDRLLKFHSLNLNGRTAKTKVLSASVRGKVTLNGVPLVTVSLFKHLGASSTAAGQAIGEIGARINLARATFNRLHTSRHEISRRTNGRFYKSVVRTILLNGCETWPLRVEDQRCLEVFHNNCLRRILGRRRLDRVACAFLRR